MFVQKCVLVCLVAMAFAQVAVCGDDADVRFALPNFLKPNVAGLASEIQSHLQNASSILSQIQNNKPNTSAIVSQIQNNRPNASTIISQIQSHLPNASVIISQIQNNRPNASTIISQIQSNLQNVSSIALQIQSHLPQGLNSSIANLVKPLNFTGLNLPAFGSNSSLANLFKPINLTGLISQLPTSSNGSFVLPHFPLLNFTLPPNAIQGVFVNIANGSTVLSGGHIVNGTGAFAQAQAIVSGIVGKPGKKSAFVVQQGPHEPSN